LPLAMIPVGVATIPWWWTFDTNRVNAPLLVAGHDARRAVRRRARSSTRPATPVATSSPSRSAA